MKTLTINTYSFNELSESAQSKAIENNRYINLDYDWHDYLIESFEEELNKIGFEDAKIQYSGFHSQGDGLCFDAKINLSKIAQNVNEKRIANLINEGYIDNYEIRKASFANFYSHEKTRYVEYYETDKDNINKVMKEISNYVESLRISMCNRFYKELEIKYSYCISDQSVKETLIANEYDFTEYGELI